MEPDDAADLLAEMPAGERQQLLGAMPADRAADLRRLLSYDATTAGGLMTSKPVIVSPEAPVAEVLARIRQPAKGVTEAAQIYVCEPPGVTPTGRYLGLVGFQRLLREAPSEPVGQCIDDSSYVRPDLPEREVATRLAAYNLVGIAVCDDAGRLLGAVTVDDVLDRLLPANWRKRGK
jgi:Mg/Co/Ni transporter MgtE